MSSAERVVARLARRSLSGSGGQPTWTGSDAECSSRSDVENDSIGFTSPWHAAPRPNSRAASRWCWDPWQLAAAALGMPVE
ncbi:MAG: hypothetical protein ACRDTG_07365 [Pseudonocardiaceae bacterium]